MDGKIIRGIAGFYYVHVPNQGIYECKARGLFRNQNIKPLIGDNVHLEILDSVNHIGNIVEIKKRRNQLVRPAVANIDQAMIVFSVHHPKPSLNLLDRFLVMIQREEIHACICFNKIDSSTEQEYHFFKDIYEKAGYQVFMTSAKYEKGIIPLSDALKGCTTVFAGPSGVGKSSLLNLIQKSVRMETGEISEKLQRGKHTTRHAELIYFDENSYVVDTPGFSSLALREIEKQDLKNYFVDFFEFQNQCKYTGCNHILEPQCAVRDGVQKGLISESRYENYCILYEELKETRRW